MRLKEIEEGNQHLAQALMDREAKAPQATTAFRVRVEQVVPKIEDSDPDFEEHLRGMAGVIASAFDK